MNLTDIISQTIGELSKNVKSRELDLGMDFKLAVEAYRLHLRHLYDPMSVAAIGKIDIVPHQIIAISRMLRMDRIRLLLADDVGLGKTITVGLLIKELLLRGQIERILIVVPPILAPQWQRELDEKFDEKFEILHGSLTYNAFQHYNKVITSMEYAKLDDKKVFLSETSWDLVIIDEAHKLTLGTLRYELGKLLAQRTKHILLVTATPHDGKIENFQGRLMLLNKHLGEISSQNIRKFIDQFMIRRLKNETVDFHGYKLFPNRQKPQTIEIKFNEEELYFYRQIEGYIRNYYKKAQENQHQGAKLALIILQRRIASSIKAGLESLKRRLNTIGEAIPEEIFAAYDEAFEMNDEKTLEELEKVLIGSTSSKGRELVEEIQKLHELISLAKEIKKDSKITHLKNMLCELTLKYPKDKIIIFTEYMDTLEYLYNNISIRYLVTKIHGGMTPKEKIRQERDFNDRAHILLATDAAGEGLNLQFANIVINYELPWNPNRMEQRVGRVYRYDQKKNVLIYNIMATNTIEGEEVLKKLIDKIEEIRKIFGDQAVDVIGSIVSEKEVREIIERSIIDPKQTEEYLNNFFGIKVQLIRKIENFLSKNRFNITIAKDIYTLPWSLVNESDIERFFHIFSNRFDKKIEKKGEKVYYFDFAPFYQKETLCSNPPYVPSYIPNFLGTFDRKCKESIIEYVALGHPVVSSAIAESMSLKPFSILKGGSLSLQIASVLQFFDGEGTIVHEEPILLYLDGNDCKIVEISSIWDYESFSPGEISVRSSKQIFNFLESLSICDTEIIYEKSKKIYAIVKEKTENEITRREELLSIDYNGQIEKKKKEMKMYQKNGPKYLVEPLKKRILNLRKEYKKKVRLLEKKRELKWSICGPIAAAIILPEITTVRGKKPGTNSNKENKRIKKEVELAGMRKAMEYEHQNGRHPEDVSGEFRGYDIESLGKEITRYIEVKSFKRFGTITITEHEWRVAKKLNLDYFLYVVENALHDPSLKIIRDPYNRLSDYAEKIPKESFEIKIKSIPDGSIDNSNSLFKDERQKI
jgi:superfamily II DNA or RNA helicase